MLFSINVDLNQNLTIEGYLSKDLLKDDFCASEQDQKKGTLGNFTLILTPSISNNICQFLEI